MKHLAIGAICLGFCLGTSGAARAEGGHQIPPERLAVLGCVEAMQSDADWGQCLTLMFAPCAAPEVGSEAHVSCLRDERENWRVVFDAQYADVIEMVTAEGTVELANIIGQWTGYVGNRCNQVASAKTGTHADAAQYGCEISEIVGVSAELMACQAGVSTAPYCVLKD